MIARWVAVLSSCAFGLASGRATADEPSDARAIVNQAIEFAGGREALARYRKPFVCQQDGTAIGGKGPEAFQRKVTTHFPDKWRSDQTGNAAMTIVINGDKGWSKSRAPGRGAPGPFRLQEMNPAQAKAASERVYAQWLTTLLPLDDEAFHLSTVEEITIDNRPAVGVDVSHQDRPNVQLYFDKDTFALVKLARKVNELPFEEFYDDYAELDGLVYPKKTVHFGNGKKLTEIKTTEMKFLDSVEEGTFEQP